MRKLVSAESIDSAKKKLKRIFDISFEDWRAEAALKRLFMHTDGEHLVALFGVLENAYIDRIDGFLNFYGCPNWDVFKCMNAFHDYEEAYEEALKMKRSFLKDGLSAIGLERLEDDPVFAVHESWFSDINHGSEVIEYAKSMADGKRIIEGFARKIVDKTILANALEYAFHYDLNEPFNEIWLEEFDLEESEDFASAWMIFQSTDFWWNQEYRVQKIPNGGKRIDPIEYTSIGDYLSGGFR